MVGSAPRLTISYSDVWLEGKLLPKDSDIIVNVLGLHFDESRFPNPEVFDPERYADQPALASQYANTPDYEARDHYRYDLILSLFSKA